jgi:hypothetical protein
VVLAVPDEQALLEAHGVLVSAGLTPALIREPDLNGQATALGIFVEDRTQVRKLLARLPLMR